MAGVVLAAMAACEGAADKNANGASKDSVSASAANAVGRQSDRGGRLPVLFIGTSLTAGLGLDPDSAYPARIQRFADERGYRIEVQNAGLSGETTAGALRRVEWLLTQPAGVVILETGANDGLRGLKIDSTRKNIEAIIRKVKEDKPETRIFLVQMEAPPNMGAEYTTAFHEMYGEIAKATKVKLTPFLLEGVAGVAELNQPDGIHPNDKGEAIVALNFWRYWGPQMVAGLTIK